MNVLDILDKYHIDYKIKGKNIGKNYVGILCPYCDDNSYHRGINLDTGHSTCWLCGIKYHINKIIFDLTGERTSYFIKQTNQKDTNYYIPQHIGIKLSSFITDYSNFHYYKLFRNFIKDRGFNVDDLFDLEIEIGIGQFNNYIGFRLEYKSFIGLELESCWNLRSMLSKKYILYGDVRSKLYNLKDQEEVIFVEGIFDMIAGYKLNPNWKNKIIPLFGKSLTTAQYSILLDSKVKSCIFALDNDVSFKDLRAMRHQLEIYNIQSSIYKFDKQYKDLNDLWKVKHDTNSITC